MQQIHNITFGQAYYEHPTNFFSSVFFKIELESWGCGLYLSTIAAYTPVFTA